MKINFFIFMIILLSLNHVVYSEGVSGCFEKVKDVKVHGNGNIYFSTENICHWCKLNWGSESQISRGHATLLAAKISGRPIVFRFESGVITDCSTRITQQHASPSWIEFH